MGECPCVTASENVYACPSIDQTSWKTRVILIAQWIALSSRSLRGHGCGAVAWHFQSCNMPAKKGVSKHPLLGKHPFLGKRPGACFGYMNGECPLLGKCGLYESGVMVQAMNWLVNGHTPRFARHALAALSICLTKERLPCNLTEILFLEFLLTQSNVR